MKAIINSIVLKGLEVVPTVVTAEVQPGLGIRLTGLSDIAVKECLLRVATAVQSLGYRIPGQKITVDISPAVETLNFGSGTNPSGLDAAVALAILQASGQISLDFSYNPVVVGELGLDGELRAVNGGINFVDWARMREVSLVLPETMVPVKGTVGNKVIAVRSLSTLIKGMSSDSIHPDVLVACRNRAKETASGKPCYQDDTYLDGVPLSGKQLRALEIAVAGGFDMFVIGSTGSGRGALVQAYSLLRRMAREGTAVDRSAEQALSAGSKGQYGYSLSQRFFPLRRCFAGTSVGALVEEMCLAHNGVLFIEELLDTPKALFECIRGVLAENQVNISGLRYRLSYPAEFNVVFAADESESPSQKERLRYYQNIFSARSINVDMAPADRCRLDVDGTASRCRMGIERALARQGGRTNASVTAKEASEFLSEALPGTAKALDDIIGRMGPGMNGGNRILRIARTIADLENSDMITPDHIVEAASF